MASKKPIEISAEEWGQIARDQGDIIEALSGTKDKQWRDYISRSAAILEKIGPDGSIAYQCGVKPGSRSRRGND